MYDGSEVCNGKDTLVDNILAGQIHDFTHPAESQCRYCDDPEREGMKLDYQLHLESYTPK